MNPIENLKLALSREFEAGMSQTRPVNDDELVQIYEGIVREVRRDIINALSAVKHDRTAQAISLLEMAIDRINNQF